MQGTSFGGSIRLLSARRGGIALQLFRDPFTFSRTCRMGSVTGNRPVIPVLKSAPAAVAKAVQALRNGLAFPVPPDLYLRPWQKPCACL